MLGHVRDVLVDAVVDFRDGRILFSLLIEIDRTTIPITGSAALAGNTAHQSGTMRCAARTAEIDVAPRVCSNCRASDWCAARQLSSRRIRTLPRINKVVPISVVARA